MKNIKKAIQEWIDKNKGDVCFVGSFVVFDKNSNVKDDLVVAYGAKGAVEASLEGVQEMLAKDKDEFISW